MQAECTGFDLCPNNNVNLLVLKKIFIIIEFFFNSRYLQNVHFLHDDEVFDKSDIFRTCLVKS